MENKFKLAVCQMKTVVDKKENLRNAIKMINEAAALGAKIVVLPEMFNCPYDNACFPEYAEKEQDSETISSISEAAAKSQIHIVAGSIPEIDNNNIYNTSFIFDESGNIIEKHRKLHLFDIDIKEKIRFKESDTLSAGNSITVIQTKWCKIGVAICYDVRFPEIFRLMALEGAEVIVVPGAFNMTTGPAHWELLMRARAVDNQVCIAAASPARDWAARYVAYGNSIIVDSWGNVISRAGEEEEIIISEIDLSEIGNNRSQMPLVKHLRHDIYELIKK